MVRYSRLKDWLAQACAQCPKACTHEHLPVQENTTLLTAAKKQPSGGLFGGGDKTSAKQLAEARSELEALRRELSSYQAENEQVCIIKYICPVLSTVFCRMTVGWVTCRKQWVQQEEEFSLCLQKCTCLHCMIMDMTD